MPRADELRVSVRLSASDHALISAAADAVNVGVGGLIRECAVRHAAGVAREIAAGNISLRRQRVEKAVEATGGQVVPARRLSPPDPAMLARQRRLNGEKS